MPSFLKYKKITGFALAVVFLFGIHSVAQALTLTPIRLEVSGDPGTVLHEQMTLINESSTIQTFYSSYANFEAQGETGTPTFVTPKDDLGTWMEAPASVTLAAGQSENVNIKINIPTSADPGGHFAAIFWGTTPTITAPGAVAIGTKTGMLVLLSVKGTVSEKGGILGFSTDNGQTFYTGLPVSLYYRFQNSGGDRVKPVGTVAFKDIFGITEAKISGNPVEGNILPNSVRRFEVVWQGRGGLVAPKNRGGFFSQVGYEWNNFAFGRYSAHVSLMYGLKNEVASASFAFWVFPWQLIIVLIVLLLILFFVGRSIVRRYNNWIIVRAKEMIERSKE